MGRVGGHHRARTTKCFKRPVGRINTFGARSPHRSEGWVGGMKIIGFYRIIEKEKREKIGKREKIEKI